MFCLMSRFSTQQSALRNKRQALGLALFSRRQLHDEARAPGPVLLEADRALMLLDDAADYGEAQPAASALRREARHEQLVAVLLGDAGPVVGNAEADAAH